MSRRITADQFHESEGVAEWRVLGDGAYVHFPTSSLAESTRLVRAITEAAGVEGHPPAIDIRSAGVTLRLITVSHDYYGMTETDVDIARRVSEVAHELGLAADVSAVQCLLLISGAPDGVQVMPFWRAVLGYEPRPDSPTEDLVDAQDRGPGFWFEQMDEPRGDGGGAIHVAVWVPQEKAEARVQAALAAGGRMVRDRFAPTWWTLADPAGNEADISTTVGRG